MRSEYTERNLAVTHPVEGEAGEVLTAAIRQYRHNNSGEFVFGYDKELIDALIEKMGGEIGELKSDLIRLRGHLDSERKLARETIAQLRGETNDR